MTDEECKIYFLYVSIVLALKYNFEVIDIKDGYEKGRNINNIIKHFSIGFSVHWKDISMKTFDELKSEKGFYDWEHYKSLYYSKYK